MTPSIGLAEAAFIVGFFGGIGWAVAVYLVGCVTVRVPRTP